MEEAEEGATEEEIVVTKTKQTPKTLNKSPEKDQGIVQTHHIAVVITTSFLVTKVGFVKLP